MSVGVGPTLQWLFPLVVDLVWRVVVLESGVVVLESGPVKQRDAAPRDIEEFHGTAHQSHAAPRPRFRAWWGLALVAFAGFEVREAYLKYRVGNWP